MHFKTVHGASVQSASMPPPHARRDSPPDCRKRLAFDQPSYGRIEHKSEPRIIRCRSKHVND
jgi:hypothetical protein